MEESNRNGRSNDVINWPRLSSSPINEYNTEWLFDMEFPTLFPRGEVDWFQP